MLGGCAVARINSTNARENGGNGQRGNNKTQACDLRHHAILIVEHEVGLLRYWTDGAECNLYPMSVPSKERAVCTSAWSHIRQVPGHLRAFCRWAEGSQFLQPAFL